MMSPRFEPDPVAIQDGMLSFSNSPASSSANSSPHPPLPDEVLRSFQFRSQQRIGHRNGGAAEARPRDTVRSVGPSVINTEHCDATASSNHENHTDSRDGSAYFMFSDQGLDIIAAKLEAVAEELERRRIRDEKIRKIEALRERCKTLGFNISQQDLEAWANGSAATSSKRTPNQDEAQAQADEPQNVDPAPESETRFAQDSEVTFIDDDRTANSSSDAPAQPQSSPRSLRRRRGRKRTHSQVEEQDTDADGEHDSDYVEANCQSPSPDRTISMHSRHGESEARDGHENHTPMDPVNGVAPRTAWSVLVAKYPEEIALTFRAGELPKNRQVMAMLDLPAVNTLLDNPMRRARCKPWTIHDVGSSRRIDHLVAALTQIAGTAAPEACDKCEKGSGLWKGCYTRPLTGEKLNGKPVCANCMMQGNSAKCRWKQGPALPPTGVTEI
ncbi:hypothetical protein KVR01_011665 [Diaporthe batatas]|uniref:uncharacterized protein n=1 Tax=Diaporthe batatas TaxID=748121 RepID=UPI001D05954A|nr:uncharacterized protein KVR01_011665 [Diaporthe batatas]KAG8158543.1 hypothetical protein KVR01_011665 [Diaporthe batatas]